VPEEQQSAVFHTGRHIFSKILGLIDHLHTSFNELLEDTGFPG